MTVPPRSGLALAALAIAAPALAGELRVSARLSGPAPKPAPLLITRDQGSCGTTAPDESVVASGGKLANVVVAVVGAPAPPASLAVVLDQERCRYRPHVQAAPVGSTFEIVNGDPVLHNTHAYLGQATAFNVALPLKGQRVTRRLDRPGVVQIRCDVHPWMAAWVVVTEGPSGVTGADGQVTIPDLPAGTFTVTAWHERLGERKARVVVPASGRAAVDFTF